jgi:hypothetical protein
MPVEVVGVKDVLNGLSFIDEDLRVRISTAIDPLMRAVAEKAKGFVPDNGRFYLDGLSHYLLLLKDHSQSMMAV